MLNNVHGVPAGVLKTMRATIYFHVALRLVGNSTWVLDVGAPGAGNVGKNIVLNTMIRSQVKDSLRQKTIMMRHVVRMKRDMSGMTIVLGDIVGIVLLVR